jgi:hypothetical protein
LLYVARDGFVAMREGRAVYVHTGNIAEEGAWVLGVMPDAFKPLEVHFPAEPAAAKAAAKAKSKDA